MITQAPSFAKGLALCAGLFLATEASALQMNFDFAASGNAKHSTAEAFGKGYASYATETLEHLPQANGLGLNLFGELMLLHKLKVLPGFGSTPIRDAGVQARTWRNTAWGAGASVYDRSFWLRSSFRSGGIGIAVPASNGALSSVLDALPGRIDTRPVIDITDGDQAGANGDDVTAVPLPAAAWLMLSGLAAYGFSFRKRRKAAQSSN